MTFAVAEDLARFILRGVPEQDRPTVVPYWRVRPGWESTAIIRRTFAAHGIRFEFEAPWDGLMFEAGHRWPDGTHIRYMTSAE